MTALEIENSLTEIVNFTSLYQPRKGEHGLDSLFSLGRVFPTTKPQAKRFINVDVLYNLDVTALVEPLLNKHGYKGIYKLTKSGRGCRLVNQNDLKLAIKREYQC